MRILIVGSGAREHALALRLSKDSSNELFCAPGNVGTESVATNLAVASTDIPALVEHALALRVELVVVGPEAPLCAGLADALRAEGIATFGPGQAAAHLEGSKRFAKEFMVRHGIPTANFQVFEQYEPAASFVQEAQRPCVIKADGLAAGKGVVVAKTPEQALDALDAMLCRRAFGDAGARVVIEDTLVGPELSLHVLFDGVTARSLGFAQDHKRAYDQDLGPNTGGMGAYAPVPWLDPSLQQQIHTQIVDPSIAGLKLDGIDFRGVLFIGVMIHEGQAKVLEYNVRFGDPECAVLCARMEGDLAQTLWAVATQTLCDVPPLTLSGSAVAVVIASEGYPEAPKVGVAIEGLEEAARMPETSVLHAGTRRREDGRVVTHGGRVLAVTGRGDSLETALSRAYSAVDVLGIAGSHHRRDIAWQARKPTKSA
ncbi:MAG: phosphoribosylamine--glycine ligase [Deltaproteobacteria bacterium]|nr:phosphoribosylamine--glycine ligase [Deltaproteobacteria bacterium]